MMIVHKDSHLPLSSKTSSPSFFSIKIHSANPLKSGLHLASAPQDSMEASQLSVPRSMKMTLEMTLKGTICLCHEDARESRHALLFPWPRKSKWTQWILHVTRCNCKGLCKLQMWLQWCHVLAKAATIYLLQIMKMIATIPQDHERRPWWLLRIAKCNCNGT